MTKTLKLLLACSIAANALLALALAGGHFPFANPPPPATAAKPATTPPSLSPDEAKKLKTLLTATDPATLRDQLKAIGLPDDMMRTLVRERIWLACNERAKEIDREEMEAKSRLPYWQRLNDPPEKRARLNAERAELARMSNALVDETLRVLGPDPNTYKQMRMSFLSPEKAAQVDAIDYDYAIMRSQAYRDTHGFPMPGDDEKLKLLDKEEQADRLALLTPEEREKDDLRNSDSAMRIQHKYAGVDMTEAEYKAIYTLQKNIDDEYNPASLGTSPDPAAVSGMSAARAEAQNDADEQINNILGPARLAELQLQKRNDYQMLQAAADRFGLSADTVAQTYQARTDAASEARRISDDTTLDAAQKTAAYATLAEQATARIRATLGDEVGNAYINNALSWLKELPQADNAVIIDGNGNVSVMERAILEPDPAPEPEPNIPSME